MIDLIIEFDNLMIEFDEVGFEPTNLVPNSQDYTKNYKQRLIDLFNSFNL